MKRYFVIHAIPAGMVAVIRHTIQGLLLAELTNRTPVILWQSRFPYHNRPFDKGSNGFLYYFRALSSICLQPVFDSSASFCPAGWNLTNVTNDSLVAYQGEETRSDFVQPDIPSLMTSNAEVIVYTHWQHLADIIQHIPKGSDYFGKAEIEIAKIIYRKYFVLTESMMAFIEERRLALFGGRRVLGVHCRGSDKIEEYALATPRAHRRIIRNLIKKVDLVFLATDSVPYHSLFLGWYDNKMVSIDCERSHGRRGIHFAAADLKKAGRDFLLDAYLLSFCAQHIGNHGSHVSFMVQVLLRENGKPYDNFQHVNPTLVARLHRVFSFVIPFHTHKYLRPMIPQRLRQLLGKISR